jgi:CDP-glucose 4,6-dehydratase
LEGLAMNGIAGKTGGESPQSGDGAIHPAMWAGRRVLVTGHTGFKGGWLSLWLARMGAQVSGFALEPPTSPSLFEAARIDQVVRSTLADIRDPRAVEECVARARPEVVFHLAAQSLVRASYDDPVATFATNVMGTAHLLDALRRCGTVRAVVVITSDKCYENREWLWGYRESEAMGGHDPYSASKGCTELLVASWRRSFLDGASGAAHLASARAGNVIGGGDWAVDRLVPDMIRAFASGQPAVLRSPRSVRPWQHVLEPLAGYLMLAEQLLERGEVFAQGWNFGPGEDDTVTVAEVAAGLARHWGAGASVKVDPDAANLHEAALLKLDCSLARHRLRWRPRWPLDTALARVCEWHRAHLGGADVRAMCERQIDAWQACA